MKHDLLRLIPKTFAPIALLFVMACADGGTTLRPDRPESFKPRYAVRINTSPPADYVAGSRRNEEVAAIEALIARTAAADRERMRALLAKPNLDFVGSNDPEDARLMGVIGSIRYWDLMSSQGKPIFTQIRDSDDSISRVRVVVALVPSLNGVTTKATIIRRPGDNGRPLVLLSESDATADYLAAGLDAAAASYFRDGVSPGRELRFDLRRVKATTGASTSGSVGLLEMLRAARARSIPGIGNVRAMDILTERKRGP